MNYLFPAIRDTFRTKRIAIVGDIVADQFLNGTIARVSREAPVFILRHNETHTLAGGAANAAVNIASLGGKPLLVGLIGDDQNGKLLRARLDSEGVGSVYIVSDASAHTTTKVRVLAGEHHAARRQVIRIDYEHDSEIGLPLRERLLENLEAACAAADAIVISDYNYGVANDGVFERAKAIAEERSIPLLVDSRFRLRNFKGGTAATPNEEEVEQLIGPEITSEKCAALREELGFESLLVTRGSRGMLLMQKDQPAVEIEAVGSSVPVDVTGAGDTVIAVFALGLASGLTYGDAARVANHAGGIVVMKKGTASVRPDELLESLRQNDATSLSGSAS